MAESDVLQELLRREQNNQLDPLRQELLQRLRQQDVSRSAVLGEQQRRTPLAQRLLQGATGLAVEAASSVLGEELAGQATRLVRPQLEMPARSVGAMGGEAFKQVFLQPDKPVDFFEIIAAGAVPMGKGPVGRFARSTLGLPDVTGQASRRARIRATRAAVPGSGVALMEQARDEIAAIPRRIRDDASQTIAQQYPGHTTVTLRQRALQQNPALPTPNFGQVAADIFSEEQLGKTFGVALGGNVQRVSKANAQRTAVTLQDLDLVRENLGGLIGQARNAGNAVVEERLRDMLAALFEDLDTAVRAGMPGAQAYKASLEAGRRNQAALQLETLVEKFSSPRAGESFEATNIRRVFEEFRKAVTARSKVGRPRGLKNLPDFLTQDEITEIQDLLEFWSQNVPALPTRVGVNAPAVGSGQFVGRSTIAGTAAVGLNTMAGDQVINPVMAGMVGAGVSAVIGNIMMSPGGRRLLREYIARGGPISVTELTVAFIGQGARAGAFNAQDVSQSLLERFQGPRLEPNR